MALDITNIKTGYFKSNAEELLTTASLNSKSVRLFSKQGGVNAPTEINLLNTTVSFQNGKTCTLTPAGTSAISQREIVPGHIGILMDFCQNQLYDTFMSYKLNVSAEETDLPFEEYLAKDVVVKVGKELEKAVWQGDKASSNTNPNTNKFDGLVKILNADVPSANKATATSTDTILTRTMAIYNAISDDVLPDAKIFMSIANYRSLLSALLDKNYFNFKSEMNDEFTLILPSTNTEVVGVAGLAGSNVIYAGNPKNFVYGFDVEGAETDVDMWYSKDDDKYYLRMKFSAGVQVAFPNEVYINNPAA